MASLFRLTLLSTLLCAGAAVGVRLVGGGAQPLSPFAVTFMTNPDGTFCQWPCMFGVPPGTTSYTGAFRIVNQHPFARYLLLDSDPPIDIFSGRNFDLILGDSAFSVSGSPLVSSLTMSFQDKPRPSQEETPLLEITAGDVIRFLGRPSRILRRGNRALLFYPDSHMIITISLATRDPAHLDASDPDPVAEIYLPSKLYYNLLASGPSP